MARGLTSEAPLPHWLDRALPRVRVGRTHNVVVPFSPVCGDGRRRETRDLANLTGHFIRDNLKGLTPV